MRISFEVPAATKSTANLREHWAVKAKRTAAERRKVALKFTPSLRAQIRPAITVTLTRYGTRVIDDDNLRSALKGVRDGVAAVLRIDDGSRLISWRYKQVTSTPELGTVLVEIDECPFQALSSMKEHQ